MKIIVIIYSIILSLFCSSCDKKLGGAMDSWYYVHISGDSAKKVIIEYYERPEGVYLPENNIIKTDTVTMPYFYEHHYIDWGGKESWKFYLKVTNIESSNVTAIMFTDGERLKDNVCPVYYAFSKDDWLEETNCKYCLDYPIDSVYNYLKEINFPIIELTTAEKEGVVYLKDVYEWRQNN